MYHVFSFLYFKIETALSSRSNTNCIGITFTSNLNLNQNRKGVFSTGIMSTGLKSTKLSILIFLSVNTSFAREKVPGPFTISVIYLPSQHFLMFQLNVTRFEVHCIVSTLPLVRYRCKFNISVIKLPCPSYSTYIRWQLFTERFLSFAFFSCTKNEEIRRTCLAFAWLFEIRFSSSFFTAWLLSKYWITPRCRNIRIFTNIKSQLQRVEKTFKMLQAQTKVSFIIDYLSLFTLELMELIILLALYARSW